MTGLRFVDIDDIKRVLMNNIINVSLRAAKKVDAEFSNELEEVIKKLAEIYRILNVVVNYQDKEISDIKLDSKMLLWQGANSLLGALQLVRTGYFIEPNFLARHAVESLAIALVLFRDYRKYKDFKSGKLSGEKCIGEAKGVIKLIGQIYGYLSDITHPSSKWLGTYVAVKRGTVLMGGGVLDDHLYRVRFNIAILGFLCSVYHSGVELVFFDAITIHRFWEKSGSKSFKWAPSQEEKDYGKIIRKLMKQVLEDFDKT